jgi:WD40 repeat protein
MMVYQGSPFKTCILGYFLICFLSTGCKAKPPSIISSFISTMSPVVNGQGVPLAGAYDPNGPGPHHVVILTTSGTEYNDWNEDLPFGWSPSSLSEIELVILIAPEQEVSVGSQSYTGGGDITAYRHTAQAELREARTGKTLAAAEIWGAPPPPFPYAAPSNQTSIGGAHVTHEAIEQWLCLNIKSQGCWEPVQTLAGHTDDVLSVAISPDGRIIASGSVDNKIILWDVARGTRIQTFAGHTADVSSVAFSPDGRTLASGSFDDTIILWDVASGTAIQTLSGHTADVSGVAFSSDGHTLASSGSSDKTIILWDIASGTEIGSLTGHKNRVICVAFSPDGRTLASGSVDDIIILWDVVSGTEIKSLKTDVNSVAFSPDGHIFASGSDHYGKIILWDAANWEKLQTLRTQEDHNNIAFSPDGRTLASGSDNGTIILWDVASGARLLNLFGLTDAVSSVAFSPDGSTLITGSHDDKVLIWKEKK